jgi:hypothetical protein
MNIVMFMGSVNNMIIHTDKSVEIEEKKAADISEDQFDEFEDVKEPVEINIKRKSKTLIKIKEYKVVEINENEIDLFQDDEPIRHKAKS